MRNYTELIAIAIRATETPLTASKAPQDFFLDGFAGASYETRCFILFHGPSPLWLVIDKMTTKHLF